MKNKVVEFLKAWGELWYKGFFGILYLVGAIIAPVIVLLVLVLPYALCALIGQHSLKKQYFYLYFFPCFITIIIKKWLNKRIK